MEQLLFWRLDPREPQVSLRVDQEMAVAQETTTAILFFPIFGHANISQTSHTRNCGYLFMVTISRLVEPGTGPPSDPFPWDAPKVSSGGTI